MNNIEMIKNLAERNKVINSADVLYLIAQLESTQKELFDFHNQEFQQRLANAKHQLHMKDLAIHNIKASRMAQFRKRLAAEAALSAANERLSKPVVLPRMHVGFDGVSTNAGDSVRNKAISDCAEAIRTAGFTADEGKDLWLM